LFNVILTRVSLGSVVAYMQHMALTGDLPEIRSQSGKFPKCRFVKIYKREKEKDMMIEKKKMKEKEEEKEKVHVYEKDTEHNRKRQFLG